MAAVGGSLDEIGPVLVPFDGRVQVAAINAPSQLTIAGDDDAVEAVTRHLTTRGRFARSLPIPYAFHTQAMDPVHDFFFRSLGRLRPRKTLVPYISTVTGTELPGHELGKDYWWRNIREPVQFAAAVRQALGFGHRIFVEIGPHLSLIRYIQEILRTDQVEGEAIGTLRRQEAGPRCLRETLAALHVHGVPIAWDQLTPDDGRHRPFPKYPWQRQSFWTEASEARNLRLGGPIHPLLGSRQNGAGAGWQADLGVEAQAFLKDHALDGKPVFPAAGYLEVLLAAVARGEFGAPVELTDVHFERVLWMDHSLGATNGSTSPPTPRLSTCRRCISGSSAPATATARCSGRSAGPA
jgi:acyl transferase domain-containing protein